MWVTKLMIPQVKKRIFCPKTTKFGPKLAFLVDMGQAMQAYSVPCWWVSRWLWRAGCISQDTYLLYFGKSRIKCQPTLSIPLGHFTQTFFRNNLSAKYLSAIYEKKLISNVISSNEYVKPTKNKQGSL